MKTSHESTVQIDIGRLEHALSDSRNFPSAYPVLSRYGLMERTPNGFKAIDPDAIVSRCRELLGKLYAQ